MILMKKLVYWFDAYDSDDMSIYNDGLGLWPRLGLG